jgi:hypothetical protein
MNRSEVREWIDSYVAAWRNPSKDKLAELFTADVRYQLHQAPPWYQSLSGLAELALYWEHVSSEQGEFELQADIVALEGTVAVVKIDVTYAAADPARWHNVWIIRFGDDGRCESYEEWPFSLK